MSRSIVLAIDVDATQETLIKAITSQEGLESFWTSDVTASNEVGADLRFGFASAPVDLGMRLESRTGDSVNWSCQGPWPFWGGTTVEWSMAPSEMSQTQVLFKHAGWDEKQPDREFGSVAMVWALVLQGLKAYAETGVAAPALG